LEFDSFIESGNLDKVEKIKPYEYALEMRVDTNTRGHQQWFNFCVKGMKPDKKYTFKIKNFTKPLCLYRSDKMCVWMKSKRQTELEKEKEVGSKPD
jgi:hypothetical protein